MIPALKLPEESRLSMACAAFVEEPLESPAALSSALTSPARLPEKFVADVALPFSPAVMVPALKLPEESRGRAALATFVDKALETSVALCVPVTSPARLPEKFVADVAVVALPSSPAAR